MQVDDVIIKLGEFGKYQRIQYFLLCLPAIVTGIHTFASVFLLGVPTHRCMINVNDTSYDDPAFLEDWIPRTEKNDTWESCLQFSNRGNRSSVVACESGDVVYDTTYFGTTLVTELSLVCADKAKKTLSSTLYMVGVLVGSFTFGILSDAFGRKKILLLAIFLQAASGTACYFAPEFWSFTLLRLLVAAASLGQFMTAFVLGMELIGPSKRLIAGVAIEFFFATAYFVLTPLAYFVRNFRTLQLIISVIGFPFLLYFWITPESVRWLTSKGRYDDAEKILRRAAKTNKVELPDKLLARPDDKEEIKLGGPDNGDQGSKDVSLTNEGVTAIFKAKVLLMRSFIIFFNWLVIAMAYYALTLNAGNLGNVYVSFVASGAVEFPAYAFCFLCNRLGRKWPHVGGMMLGSVASFGSLLLVQFEMDPVEYNWLFIVLNTVAKFGVSIGFAIIYFWSAEIFPTPVRNTMMGLSSTIARLGAIVAPFMADLKDYVPGKLGAILPFIIVGSLMIVAALLATFLPETANQPLPETIAEANRWDFSKPLTNESNGKSMNSLEQESAIGSKITLVK